MQRILVLALMMCQAAIARADLGVDPPTDVGQIRAGARLTQTFHLVNDGSAVIDALEARPDCGCLVARLDTSRLAPGERGTVTMLVNTIGQAAGAHTWRATLHYRENSLARQTVVELRANL